MESYPWRVWEHTSLPELLSISVECKISLSKQVCWARHLFMNKHAAQDICSGISVCDTSPLDQRGRSHLRPGLAILPGSSLQRTSSPACIVVRDLQKRASPLSHHIHLLALRFLNMTGGGAVMAPSSSPSSLVVAATVSSVVFVSVLTPSLGSVFTWDVLVDSSAAIVALD